MQIDYPAVALWFRKAETEREYIILCCKWIPFEIQVLTLCKTQDTHRATDAESDHLQHVNQQHYFRS